jgi:photosynthetic reaction center cytochrome c subunit
MKALVRMTGAVALLGSVALLAGCERPPVDSVQHGYRGTGMVQVYNPRTVDKLIPLNAVPESLPAAGDDGPKAGEVYQNVKVLGNLSVGRFTRLMVSMSQWVAPEQGCNYCHNAQNLADDSLYTKVVARRMIQMTQNVNANWGNHVQQTGVTCYTCHRGQPVPQYTWFSAPPQDLKSNFIGDKAEQNTPARSTTLATLPYDSFTYFLKNDYPIRVRGTEALPYGNRASIKQAEFTYSLMIHMSDGLGVNCTYCHNTRAFADWASSPPQRVPAWYGIRMVREINNTYLEPLANVFPENRKGELGDVAKTNCATCHQGAYKPLFGASMLKDYPELGAAPAAQQQAADGVPTGVLAKVLFEVNQTALSPESKAAIVEVAARMKAYPNVKLDISGFADKTGAATKNLEIAKQRAFAVRDALKASGVPEAQVNLKKPEFVIGDASGNSRRVDIVAAP